VNAPIRSRRRDGECGEGPRTCRPALGTKLAVLLLLVALFLIVYVTGLFRGLG
jgi:hypothetical protein